MSTPSIQTPDTPITPITTHKRTSKQRIPTPITPVISSTKVREHLPRRSTRIRKFSDKVLSPGFDKSRKEIRCLSLFRELIDKPTMDDIRRDWLKKMLWRGIHEGMKINRTGNFSRGFSFTCFEPDYEELLAELDQHVVSTQDKKRCVKLRHYKIIRTSTEFMNFFGRLPDTKVIPRKKYKCLLQMPVIFTYNSKYNRVDIWLKYLIVNERGYPVYNIHSKAVTRQLKEEFKKLKKNH